MQEDHRKTVPAVDRALKVLEMLAVARKGLTLSEIARNLNVGRSSAFYVMGELENNGYVCRPAARGRYFFTAKLFTLANNSLVGLGIREQAKPILQALMAKTQLTVHMGVLAQGEVVIVERVTPAAVRQLPTWIGKRLPVHCTGAGKALMAYQPPDAIQRFLALGLIRYNENTIVSPARFEQELQRIRKLGYALDDEEETIGLRCIGAPVFDGAGDAVAACSIAGTSEQIREENLSDLVSLVKQSTAQITAKLKPAP